MSVVSEDPRYCPVCRHGETGSCDERCELRSDAVRRVVAGLFPWQQSGVYGVIRRLDDHAGCAVLSIPRDETGRRMLVYVSPSGAWTHDVTRARVIGAR